MNELMPIFFVVEIFSGKKWHRKLNIEFGLK